MTDNPQFVASLRAIADWYEAHPEAPLPSLSQISVFSFDEETVAEAARIGRLLGSFDKEVDDDFFALAKMFEAIKLRFVFYRNKICTPRVVGTRTVKKKVYPAHVEPAEVEVQEDIVEWDCPSLLAPEPVEMPHSDTLPDAGVAAILEEHEKKGFE